MKQTLEEEVNSISGVHPDWSRLECFRKGFKEGAEWHARQSLWISVNERLPEENTSVFFAVEWNALHKVGYFVGLYSGNGYWQSEYNIFLPGSPIVHVIHWMPIPSFDEILEANRDVLERIKEKGD